MFQLPPASPVHVTFEEFPLGEADWWVAGGTVALAFITAILAWYTYRLFRATQQARADSLEALEIARRNAQTTKILADAAVRQAQLTAEQAALSRETMIRTLKAELIVENVDVAGPQQPDRFGITTLTLTNIGNSPARNVEISYSYDYRYSRPTEFHASDPNYYTFSIGAISPKHSRQSTFVSSDRIADQKITEDANLEHLFHGQVKYTDGMTNAREAVNFTYYVHSQTGTTKPVGPMNGPA